MGFGQSTPSQVGAFTGIPLGKVLKWPLVFPQSKCTAIANNLNSCTHSQQAKFLRKPLSQFLLDLNKISVLDNSTTEQRPDFHGLLQLKSTDKFSWKRAKGKGEREQLFEISSFITSLQKQSSPSCHPLPHKHCRSSSNQLQKNKPTKGWSFLSWENPQKKSAKPNKKGMF